ncbi:MAG: hypothetical protein DRO40_01740 [Thermoprotei archaeon]|nr:MAG: hypothetical protein DRO40_01740 [Thermoprotei archaeon]
MVVALWLMLSGFAAFLVAWINGANNAADAIGTAIGARALGLKKALYIAALFDFIGAMLFGRYVSVTLLKGIVDTSMFNNVSIVVYGMTSALLATSLWTIFATWCRIPMSISQAIVGGIVGFGIVSAGIDGINWSKVLAIVIAWILVFLLSGVIAMCFYKLLSPVTRSLNINRLIGISDVLIFIFIFLISFLYTVNWSSKQTIIWCLGISVTMSSIAMLLWHVILLAHLPKDVRSAKNFIFRSLLLISVMFIAFSHGAGDVANSAGPLAGIMYAVTLGYIPRGDVHIPYEILVFCGAGIAIGILSWGYRVVKTIGEKITPLNIETAFMAQFSGSIAKLVMTRLGLPVSTTAAIVGAVAGLGFARGSKNVDKGTLFTIILTWFIAFPVVAFMTILFYILLSMLA